MGFKSVNMGILRFLCTAGHLRTSFPIREVPARAWDRAYSTRIEPINTTSTVLPPPGLLDGCILR